MITHRLNRSNTVKIALFLLVLAVVGLGYYAYRTTNPQNIMVTNLTDRSVSISWSTLSPSTGKVVVSEGSQLIPFRVTSIGKEAYPDDRDYAKAELELAKANLEKVTNSSNGELTGEQLESKVEVKKNGKYYLHHVTIKDLKPETEYSFMVGNGSFFVKKSAVNTTAAAFTTLTEQETVIVPDPAYGLVKEFQAVDQPAITDGVLYLQIEDQTKGAKSSYISSPLGNNGSWYLDLTNAKEELTSEPFMRTVDLPSETVIEHISINAGPKGTLKTQISIHADAPAQTLLVKSDSEETLFSSLQLVSEVYAGEWSISCNGHSYCEDDPSVHAAFWAVYGYEDGQSAWEDEACGSGAANTTCGGSGGGTGGGSTTPPPQEPPTGGGGSGGGSSSGSCEDNASCCGANWAAYTKPVGAECGVEGDTGDVSIAFCPSAGGCDGFGPLSCSKCASDGKYYCTDGNSGACGVTSGSGGQTGGGSSGTTGGQTGTGTTGGTTGGSTSGSTSGNPSAACPSGNFAGDAADYSPLNGGCYYDLTASVTWGSANNNTNNPTCPSADSYDCFYVCSATKTVTCGSGQLCDCSGAGVTPGAGAIWVNSACTVEGATELSAGLPLICKTGKWRLEVADGQSCTASTCFCSVLNQILPGGVMCGSAGGAGNPGGNNGAPGGGNNGAPGGGNNGNPGGGNADQDGGWDSHDCPADPGASCDGCRGVLGSTGGSNYLCTNEGNDAQGWIWTRLLSNSSGNQPDAQEEDCPSTAGYDNSCVCQGSSQLYTIPPGASCEDVGITNQQGTLTISRGAQCCNPAGCWCDNYGVFGADLDNGEWCTQANSSLTNGCWAYGQADVNNVKGLVCHRDGWACSDTGYCTDQLADTCGGQGAVPNQDNERVLGISVATPASAQEVRYTLGSNGTIAFSQNGVYCTEATGGKYCFDVPSEGEYNLYIDTNNNGTFDEGSDTTIAQNFETLTLARESGKFTYNFQRGINIVSFNFVNEDIGLTASQLLSYLNTEYSDGFFSIAEFESGAWKVVGNRAGETYTGQDFQIIPGKGYLIRAKNEIFVEMTGNEIIEPAPTLLRPGWNLIGVHGGQTTYTAESLIDSINALQTLNANNVSKWDVKKGKYEGLQKELDANNTTQVYGFDYPILSSVGYFVRVKEGEGSWQPE